jgi:hypothetical protein
MPIKKTRERLALEIIAGRIANRELPHEVVLGTGREGDRQTVTVGDIIKDALEMKTAPWEEGYKRKGSRLSDTQWVELERTFRV